MTFITKIQRWVVYNETGQLRIALAFTPEVSPTFTIGLLPCRGFEMKDGRLKDIRAVGAKVPVIKQLVADIEEAGWEFGIGLKTLGAERIFSIVLRAADQERFLPWLEAKLGSSVIPTPKQAKEADDGELV